MAADFIVVNRGKPLGNRLVEAANSLLKLSTEIRSMTATGQHGFDASGYTVFEEQFGLAAGTGAGTLTLLTLIDEILNSTVDHPGAARLQQLNEFTARLAGQ